MSKSVIEDLRRTRSRLDEVEVRCARRTATIESLKAEVGGWYFLRGQDLSDRPSRTAPRNTPADSGRRPGSR